MSRPIRSQFEDFMRHVHTTGVLKADRTGTGTRSVFGHQMRFDLSEGFPLVTTKKVHLKSIILELLWFLRGDSNVKWLQERGCTIWDEWARDDGDLGPVYGVQWRQWPAYKLLPAADTARIEAALGQGYRVVGPVDDQGGPCVLLYKAVDQLRACLDTLIRDPGSRRILFHGWNWAQLDEMALPPCHLLYQFLANPATRELSLCLYIRSNDVGLGTPFNLAEGAALTHLVARLTGYEPRWFTYFIGDAHIYETHVDMLREQLKRDPLPPPRLRLSDRIPAYADTGRYEPEWLERLEPGDFTLEDYRHHAPLTAPMAV